MNVGIDIFADSRVSRKARKGAKSQGVLKCRIYYIIKDAKRYTVEWSPAEWGTNEVPHGCCFCW